MAQVMQSQAIFALTLAAAEIPTGYFADRFGRRTSILCGAILCGLSFSGLIFVQNFLHVLVYEVTIGIAMGLISGADIALIYDQLHQNFPAHGDSSASNFSKASTKAFANLQLSLVLGESVAALISGFLAVKGIGHVVIAQAVVGWIPLICVLFISERKGEKSSLENLNHFRRNNILLFNSNKL